MHQSIMAILGGVAGMIGYGSADFFAKKTIDRIGILKSVFYSQLISVIFLLLFLFQDPSMPVLNIQVIITLVLFGFFWAAGYLALYRAFEVGKISVVSPITSAFAALAAINSFLFFREPFSFLKLIAIVLITIGVVLTAIDLKELKKGLKLNDLVKGVPEAFFVLLIFGFFWPLWDQFTSRGGWVILTIIMRMVAVTTFFLYALLLRKESLSLSLSLVFIWLPHGIARNFFF